jgi:hypothetical protein
MKILIRFSLSIGEWSFDQVAVTNVKKSDDRTVEKAVDNYMLNFYGSYTNDVIWDEKEGCHVPNEDYDGEEICNGTRNFRDIFLGNMDYEYFHGEIAAKVTGFEVIKEKDYKVLRRLNIA